MVRAEMSRATISSTQATKTLQEAELYLTGVRWEWECCRSVHLQAAVRYRASFLSPTHSLLTKARSLSLSLSRSVT